jgi:glycosyltransferase involved in cell wall biosynthesis
LYSSADVFVAPSLIDAFGKTLVESMACGTPVVCFDATGPSEIIDHQLTGYKASPYVSSELAEGVEWLLGNENSYQVVVFNARQKVLQSFDVPVIARQYAELYNSIA